MRQVRRTGCRAQSDLHQQQEQSVCETGPSNRKRQGAADGERTDGRTDGRTGGRTDGRAGGRAAGRAGGRAGGKQRTARGRAEPTAGTKVAAGQGAGRRTGRRCETQCVKSLVEIRHTFRKFTVYSPRSDVEGINPGWMVTLTSLAGNLRKLCLKSAYVNAIYDRLW